MVKIQSLECHKILNSRASWTIETHVTLDDGSCGVQQIPDGASKGDNEAVYIPVDKAVSVVEGPLLDLLKDEDPFDQKTIDTLMIKMDGTQNKSNLGGNSILSVSLAVARACAQSRGVELYKYLAKLAKVTLNEKILKFPTPLFNVINGGKHAANNLSFQEFMVIPSPNIPYEKALEIGVDIYHALADKLKMAGYSISVGDEGGFAPNDLIVHKALELLRNSIPAKYKVGHDIFFGMDIAAGSFKENEFYKISEENLSLTTNELDSYLKDLLAHYELIYLEDPFYEKDFVGWQNFYSTLKDKVMIVADDLVVTNKKFLQEAIANKYANAVIVKPNQVGTLTETLEFIQLARENAMSIIVSHRSGDTAEDTFVADLALAIQADFVKFGAPARGERVAKYNRLLDIISERL